MSNPCAFSPDERQARHAAGFFARMFATCESVLDIGFGQGYFLEACKAVGVRGVGIDRDADLVRDAQRRGFEAYAVDARDLRSVLHQPVDGAMASHLAEHLTPAELRAVLSDIAQVVRPGGCLILATPNFADWRVASEWFWLDPTHIRPYPAGAVQQLLDSNEWRWVADGYEPMVMTRQTPVMWANRFRFGREYGRPGRWYHLERAGG